MITPFEDRARAFAQHAHGAQKYGQEPYIVHLAAVRSVLAEYRYTGDVLVAAWLHDTLEDTKTTFKQLQAAFGQQVAMLVASVTNGPGKNRRERNEMVYQRLRAQPAAIPLKLADRIANMRASLKNNPELLVMYQREYLDFKGALYPHSDDCPMWRELDTLAAAGRPS